MTPPSLAPRPSTPAPDRDIRRLIDIMARLRTPGDGCAWDLAQTFATIAPCAVEEAYEVADAIARDDLLDLRDELGDLLLQVVFHARMAEEQGVFDFGDVVQSISNKLIRRHPHIFADARDLTPDQVQSLWNEIKAREKAARLAERGRDAPTFPTSVLHDVPVGLPPLARALKLQDSAATLGFDWPDVAPVFAKVREEVDEIEEALGNPDATTRERSNEIGDLLFAVVNLARHAGVDPDRAMHDANAKFTRRFAAVEAGLVAVGKTPDRATLAEMDRLWDAAKAAEPKPPRPSP